MWMEPSNEDSSALTVTEREQALLRAWSGGYLGLLLTHGTGDHLMDGSGDQLMLEAVEAQLVLEVEAPIDVEITVISEGKEIGHWVGPNKLNLDLCDRPDFRRGWDVRGCLHLAYTTSHEIQVLVLLINKKRGATREARGGKVELVGQNIALSLDGIHF